MYLTMFWLFHTFLAKPQPWFKTGAIQPTWRKAHIHTDLTENTWPFSSVCLWFLYHQTIHFHGPFSLLLPENYINPSLQIFNTISLSLSTCAIILQRKLKKLGKKFHKLPSPLSSTFIASETDSLFLYSPLILEINRMCAYLRTKLLHCPGLSFSFKDIGLKFFLLLFSTINFFSLCKTSPTAHSSNMLSLPI